MIDERVRELAAKAKQIFELQTSSRSWEDLSVRERIPYIDEAHAMLEREKRLKR